MTLKLKIPVKFVFPFFICESYTNLLNLKSFLPKNVFFDIFCQSENISLKKKTYLKYIKFSKFYHFFKTCTVVSFKS